MSTVQLPNIRIGSDVVIKAKLHENGVAVNWSTLTGVKAFAYSDTQRIMGGELECAVSQSDPYELIVNYRTTVLQYLGPVRLVVRGVYQSNTKTFDVPAFNFVATTAEATGVTVLADPQVSVTLVVTEIASSVIQEIVDACIIATGKCTEVYRMPLQVKLENNHLYASYDRGATWNDLGEIQGTGGFDIHTLTPDTYPANADEFAMYKSSASAHRKITWQNIMSRIQTALGSVFAALSHTHTKSQITDFPTIPSALSDLTEDATHRTVTDAQKNTWTGKQDTLVSGTNIKTVNNQSLLGAGNIEIQGGGSSFNIHSLTEENTLADADELAIYDISASAHRKTTWGNILGKIGAALSSVFAAISHTHTKSQITDFPTIPSSLSDLSDDSTHRTVTDTEKSNWNGKGTYSKPANGIPASDLASGVIPSVPTIATTLNAQSVNTQTAGAKAVYDAIEAEKDIIYGYMHNGTFYLTRTGSIGEYVYSDAVTPETDMQYTDKEGNVPYIWNGIAYTAIGGGGGSMQGAVRYDQVQSLSGEEQARALANLGLTFEDIMSYGIEFDTAVSSPTCTRIGNTDLHRSLPVHSLMKGCLLNDSGQVVEYLPETDWTGSTRDGSQGQVMVEIPAHYRKFETQGTKRRVRISQTALPGYHIVPKQYVSAYQATVQRSVNKLASVVNNTADYRGGSNTSAWDELAKSLLGRPASSISRTNFRAYARNRGAAGKNNCGWNCMTYDIQKELYWLYVIEYATLDSQAAYNAQLTVDGCHQGGLGDGVSTWDSSSWNNFNDYNPFVPCGHTDSLGNRTGVVQYDVKNDEQTIIKSFSVPRYRGVENPFVHIWQWTDGINIQIRPASDSEPLSKVYIASDPAVFNDSNYDGYTYVGNEARSDGYVKTLIFGDGGEIMPDTVGGGSTTYLCDYHYTNIPSAVTLRGVSLGGNASDGAYGGFVYARSDSTPSYTYANVGSRLCFIPA